MRIGEYLAQLREARGWSIREAAKRCGVSYSRWNELEKGISRRSNLPTKPSVDLLMRIGQSFNIPLATLLEMAGLSPASADEALEAEVIGLLRRLKPQSRQLAVALLRTVAETGGQD